MTKHIQNAFVGDEEIFKYYDPSRSVSSIDEIVEDINQKLEEYKWIFDTEFVPLEHGYIFYTKNPRLLVSFGMNIDHRIKDEMSCFWNTITQHLGESFDCYLWAVNTRAIGWLKRMGMKEVEQLESNKHTVIHLKY